MKTNREAQVDHVVESLDLLPDRFRQIGLEPPSDQKEFFQYVVHIPNTTLEELLKDRIMSGVKPFRYSAMVKMIANGGFDPAQDLRTGITLEMIRSLHQGRVADAKDSVDKWQKALENWESIFS